VVAAAGAPAIFGDIRTVRQQFGMGLMGLADPGTSMRDTGAWPQGRQLPGSAVAARGRASTGRGRRRRRSGTDARAGRHNRTTRPRPA
jgi:hypothetical protein